MKRRQNETFDAYKSRRKNLQGAIKSYLRGRTFVPNNTKVLPLK